MNDDKYQFSEKARYLSLLLLKDELRSFDQELSRPIVDSQSWLTKLRNTRYVFLALNNVRDTAIRSNLKGSEEYVLLTRSLKKKLLFANHFRNRAVGHLNETLLERAAQWFSHLFSETLRDNEEFKTIEAQRSVIESSVNSFLDHDGNQKTFGTEIDLMYPPNRKMFFEYLHELVQESLTWVTESAELILAGIEHYGEEELEEHAAIAGQTNFDLKADPYLNSRGGMKKSI